MLRLRRLLDARGHLFMVPLDHGVSMGPAPGLADPRAVVRAAAAGGATCITLHKGLLGTVAADVGGLGVLLHLSASTDGAPDPHDKRLVATVDDALAAGCDGVSIHVNVGSATEARQLEDMGHVSSACRRWGMPLVAMMYPRGPQVKDPTDARLVAHAARLGAELGADAVKVPYTGSAASFRAVVDGCPVPVLVAGGPKADAAALAKALADAKAAGARGMSVGRSVFQQPEPVGALRRLVAAFG